VVVAIGFRNPLPTLPLVLACGLDEGEATERRSISTDEAMCEESQNEMVVAFGFRNPLPTLPLVLACGADEGEATERPNTLTP